MNLNLTFPTGILTHQVEDKVSNYIESIIVPRLKNLENANKYSIDNVSTDFFKDKKIINKKELLPLTKEVTKCVEYYANEVSEPVGNYEYWVQDYNKYQFHGKHNHGRSTLFSVVYFVRASDNAGNLVLEESNPLKELWFRTKSTSSPCKNSSLHVKPKKGFLVVFPGYLPHHALPSETDCIRTIISYNFFG